MQRPWFEHYPPNVAQTVDPSRYPTLNDLCDEAYERYPNARAFGNFGSYLAFANVEQHSKSFATFLQQDLGIESGDRVALMMPNILSYPIAMLGALRVGACVVNTNPQYTARELRHQLVDSGARCLVVFRNMLPVVQEVANDTALEHVVVTELGDLFAFPKSILYNRAARRRQEPINDTLDIESTTLNEALKRGSKGSFRAPDIGPDALAFLQYTGGTTGVSKGAMLSHENLIANILQVGSWLDTTIEHGKEVVITALPLYHIYALTVNCFSFFRYGAQNYLITDPRDTARFIKELHRVPFTGFAGVNTLFISLLNHEKFSGLDFSKLKYTSGGGAAIQSAVAKDWQAQTGAIISEGYGLTEASPAVCVNPFTIKEFTGCIGIPLPSTDCRIVNDAGEICGINEPGELQVRGPQVMRGYWNRKDETQQTIDEQGWLKTGDIAVMRDDGFFKIVDRKKDMILVSGFNVFPNEIEDVLASHPGVREAAVIGVDDEKTTEAVKAVIIPNDPTPSVRELREFCRKHLTAYKVPRYIECVSDLPKSNIGKILRREVKARYGTTA